jgi:RNA polymerase sigma factor (sigma-70 family)
LLSIDNFIKTRLRGLGSDFDDVYQHVWADLLARINQYDPKRARLTTWSWRVIWHSVIRWKSQYTRLVRVPDYLQSKEGKGSKYEKLAKRETRLIDDYTGLGRYLMLEDDGEPGEGTINHGRLKWLQREIRMLNEQERFVIKSRLKGLNGPEIAELMGVTKQRVKQIEQKAVEVLRVKVFQSRLRNNWS